MQIIKHPSNIVNKFLGQPVKVLGCMKLGVPREILTFGLWTLAAGYWMPEIAHGSRLKANAQRACAALGVRIALPKVE